MKTIPLHVALFLGVVAENTLSKTRSITPVGAATQRSECNIVQCLEPSRFVTDCKAAVADGCTYNETIVINGEVSGDDLCVVNSQPVAASSKKDDMPYVAEGETQLWPKLDLSLALADPTDRTTLKRVAGEMYLTSTLPNSGASATLRLYASPSQDCDTSVDTAISASSIGAWAAGSSKFDLAARYPASFAQEILDGTHWGVFNSTLDVQSIGSIAGFYANKYTISKIHELSNPTLVPEFKMGSQTVQSASGSCIDVTTCKDKTTLEGIYECILSGEDECDVTATYTISDTVTPARGYCASSDNKSHVMRHSLLPDGAKATQATGTLTFTMGSVPATSCAIEVKGMGTIDTYSNDCGLKNVTDAIPISTAQVDPQHLSFTVSSVPDGITAFILVADKEWSNCGGGIRSLSTTSLTSVLSYVKETSTTTTTAAPETLPSTGEEDPFDSPASEGVIRTFAFAVGSALSMLALLL